MGLCHRRVWQLIRAHPARAWFLVLAVAAIPMMYLAVPARRECPVTEEKCALIKEGMTREEVRAILGVPSGDYTGGKSGYVGSRFLICDPESCESWKGPDCWLEVFYDTETGLVDLISIKPMMRMGEISILGRVRLLLRDLFDPGTR
jgi:hypothetical protein